MKALIFVLFLVLIGCAGFAQGLTKSAEKEGSILFRGNSVSFDIGQTELNANINNLKSTLGKPYAPFFGLLVTGQNDSGLGNVFKSGSFVPAASFGGYAGISFSWGVPENYKEEYEKKKATWKAFETSFDADYKKQMQTVIDQYKSGTSASLALTFENILYNSTLETFLESVKTWGNISDDESKDLKDDVEDKAKEMWKVYKHKILPIRKWIAHDHKIVIENKLYKQLMIFGFGSFEGSEFKQALTVDLVNLQNSFKTINYRGGWGGVGGNFQIENLMIGLTWAYKETNNFALLDKKEYTLRTITNNTSNTSSLIAEKKITAYEGDYSEVIINEVKADIIYRIVLSEESDEGQLLLNPYLRSQSNSRNSTLLPNKTDLGFGTYFFNKEKKFLGGLYLELPDINNNYEKNKKPEDQNLRPALKRITFGVVGKLSIATLMNTF